jgi:hypothetical protein
VGKGTNYINGSAWICGKYLINIIEKQFSMSAGAGIKIICLNLYTQRNTNPGIDGNIIFGADTGWQSGGHYDPCIESSARV